MVFQKIMFKWLCQKSFWKILGYYFELLLCETIELQIL